MLHTYLLRVYVYSHVLYEHGDGYDVQKSISTVMGPPTTSNILEHIILVS